MGKQGAGAGLFSTWKRAAFSPSALYAGDFPADGRLPPLPFALAVGAIAYPLTALAQGGIQGGLARALVALLVSPFAVLLSVYLGAAFVHLGLILVGGRHGTFHDTVTAVCYAQAPAVFGVVPLLGTIIGALWSLVVLAVGLQHAQRTTAVRAWLALGLGSLAVPVLGALGLRAFFIEAFRTPSGSMMPTLMIGDHIFVEKLTYGPLVPGTDARLYSGLPPRRGDVMVFEFPENKNVDFIKRAIALPGDTLEAINGRPVINGWLVPHCRVGTVHHEDRTQELFVEHLGDRDYLTLFDADPDAERCAGAGACGEGNVCRAGICGRLKGPFHVAANEVWVVGDNRDHSHDSRFWRGGLGAGVPFENIKGRATIVWMSFLPGGGIAGERLWVPVNGPPTLPPGDAALAPALEKCLRERPPVTQTTPPGR